MSIDTVTTRMATIQEGLTGITSAFAFDETPNALKDDYLPCVTNFPGASQILYPDQTGTTYTQELRDYQIWLWIVPVQKPIDAARRAEIAQDLISTVRDAFLARPQLEGLRYVIESRLQGDSGAVVSEWAGKEYLAVQFNIDVTEILNVEYAGGD